MSGESATIEFAVAALGVKDLIICGHSACGAIKGLLHPETLEDLPMVRGWLSHAELSRRILSYNTQEGQFLPIGEVKLQSESKRPRLTAGTVI
ncbi:MAG: hypothetical protein K2X27_15030 [Candidatus Obscuribacterales bacterium]|nr:hypothetical protein [Candidatus Obscuribacterales bacterium]